MRNGMLQLGLASVSLMPLLRVAAVALHPHLRLRLHLRLHQLQLHPHLHRLRMMRRRLRRMLRHGAGSRNRATASYVSSCGEAMLSCVHVGQGLLCSGTARLVSPGRISGPPRLGIRP